jgi:hypothetical protein
MNLEYLEEKTACGKVNRKQFFRTESSLELLDRNP